MKLLSSLLLNPFQEGGHTSYASPLFFAEKERHLEYKNGYAYLKAIMEERNSKITICKGSQLGFSNAMLNICIVALLQSIPVLYLLPTDSAIQDFSKARFNPMIQDSSIAKMCQTDSTSLKIINGTPLYLRGARSKSKLKEIPVGMLILDERDEMDEENVGLARERLTGHLNFQEFDLSTPRLPDTGIYKDFTFCDQYYFMIPCLKCKTRQALSLANVNIEAKHFFCMHCQQSFSHIEKIKMVSMGKWELMQKGNGFPGYHISQLYSPTVTSEMLCNAILEARGDESKTQVLYNSKLGLPYEAKGSRLTGEEIDSRLGEFNGQGIRIAGIDVSQSDLHYCVVGRVTEYGLTVDEILRLSWNDIVSDLRKRSVTCVVIDSKPETSKAKELREAFGNCWLATYPNMKETLALDEEKKDVKINRTEAIDSVFARFHQNRILITKNVPNYQEFKEHLKNTVRCYRIVKGEVEAYYTETGPDHFLHALVYMETASRLPIEAIELTERKEKFI